MFLKLGPRGRTYEAALEILALTKRASRPNVSARWVPSSSSSTSPARLPNGVPDLKGSPSLNGMREWLQLLGYPDEKVDGLNVIHVSGTKGKGSTCAFVESLLRAHGKRTGFPKKTGLYTSPHLVEVNERIRINFEPLPKPAFARYAFDVFDGLSQARDITPPRYLQLLALISFHAFAQQCVDVAIYETHHGGEYCATNVVRAPAVTAVTTLGLDHVADLGPSIENVAWHKAGIFKPGAPAFSAPQGPAVSQVLRDRAAEKGITLEFAETDPCLPDWLQPQVQRINFSLARDVSNAFLARTSSSSLSQQDIDEAIQLAYWPGRFETVRDGDTTWYLDGAHNELSVGEAAEWFRVTSSKDQGEGLPVKRVLIFAQSSNHRDVEHVLRCLAQATKIPIDHVIMTNIVENRVEQSRNETEALEAYSSIWKEYMPNSQVSEEPTIGGAVAAARAIGGSGCSRHVLVTGSLHLVGGVLGALKGLRQE